MWFGVFLCCAFLCGLLWGWVLGRAECLGSQPYLSVVSSYLNLHFWHRHEAIWLTKWCRLFGLPFTFSSDAEVAALVTGVTMLGAGAVRARSSVMVAAA